MKVDKAVQTTMIFVLFATLYHIYLFFNSFSSDSLHMCVDYFYYFISSFFLIHWGYSYTKYTHFLCEKLRILLGVLN
jgi:Co/Zn/Cd efflux system component